MSSQHCNNLDVSNRLRVDGCIILNGKKYTTFDLPHDDPQSLTVSAATLPSSSSYRSVAPPAAPALPPTFLADQAAAAERVNKLSLRLDELDAAVSVQKSSHAAFRDDMLRHKDRDASTFEPRVRAVLASHLKSTAPAPEPDATFVPRVKAIVASCAPPEAELDRRVRSILASSPDDIDRRIRSVLAETPPHLPAPPPPPAAPPAPPVPEYLLDPTHLDRRVRELLDEYVASLTPPAPAEPVNVSPPKTSTSTKEILAINEKIAIMIRNNASAAKELAVARQMADRAQAEAKSLRELLNAQDRRLRELEAAIKP